MKITKQPWGTHGGQPICLYTLSTDQLRLSVTTYGGCITSLHAPDRNGQSADIVLGYDTLPGYESDKTFFGALIGRYANRIAEGRFTLNGQTYQIPINNPPNALHGGPRGFNKRIWSAREISKGVELKLISPDGKMGFPGTVEACVRYTLDGAVLRIEFEATTDKETPINLTNHSYFNLSGDPRQTILDHVVTIHADRFIPVDATLIPTGEIAPVANTPFDFTTPHTIGERIDTSNEQLNYAWGYDHTMVLRDHAPNELVLAAETHHPATGRTLRVHTTEPGVQFYTGNHLDGTAIGKKNIAYAKRTGFCLETQHFPDSPNHANFPSTILKPGETFRSTTVFEFGVKA